MFCQHCARTVGAKPYPVAELAHTVLSFHRERTAIRARLGHRLVSLRTTPTLFPMSAALAAVHTAAMARLVISYRLGKEFHMTKTNAKI